MDTFFFSVVKSKETEDLIELSKYESLAGTTILLLGSLINDFVSPFLFRVGLSTGRK
jgi:hypothetical protein